MKDFTLKETEAIRKELDIALEKIAKKFGAVSNVGNMKYGTQVTAKIEFSKVSKSVTGTFVMDKAAQTYIDLTYRHGLPKGALGREFTFKGSTYMVLGYNTRRSKYPISYTMDGKNYKCAVSFIEKILTQGLPELFL